MTSIAVISIFFALLLSTTRRGIVKTQIQQSKEVKKTKTKQEKASKNTEKSYAHLF